MINPTDILPTPENYATPDQIRAVQEYAKALSSPDNMQAPVRHWSQGVSNIVNALMGGYLTNRAGGLEKQLKDTEAARQQAIPIPNAPPGMPPVPQVQMPPIVPGKVAGPADIPIANNIPFKAASYAGDGGSDISRPREVIGGMESSGNYASKGKVTKDGDRAYGKYQVMGKNVGPWTKEVLGEEMTPDEFLHNKQAQDQVFNAKFGQYREKYGPQGAARAWFAGEHGMNNPNAEDVNHMTVANYGKKFAAGMGGEPSPQPGSAMAFNGEPAPSSAADVFAKVLAKGQPSGSGIPTPSVPSGPGAVPTLPGPQTTQATPAIPGGFDPRLIPQRQHISPQQYYDVMRSFTLPQSYKDQVEQQYRSQFQPQSFPTTGGTIVVGPDGTQQFIATGKEGTIKSGTDEVPAFMQLNPNTGQYEMRPATPVMPKAPGPGSSLSPTNAPASAAPPAREAGITPASLTAANAETKLPNSPLSAAPPAAQGPQVASLDPTSGANAFPKPVPEGVLSPAAVEPSETPATKVADATAMTPTQKSIPATPGIMPQFMLDLDNARRGREIEEQRQKDLNSKGIEYSTKKYDTVMQSARQLPDQLGLLNVMDHLLDNKQMYSGSMAGPILDLKKMQSALADYMPGLSPEQRSAWRTASAPMEAFQKIASGTVLQALRDALQGLGQVRVAELYLVQLANASLNNSIPANKAIVDVTRTAADRLQKIQTMAADYAAGAEVIDPWTGNVIEKANVKDGENMPRYGLDPHWDGLLTKTLKAHPAYPPEKVAAFEKLFGEKSPEGGAPAQGAGGGSTAAGAPLDPSKMNADQVREELRRRLQGGQ